MKKLILVSILFIFASSAGATVYKWVDEKGVVNFVDDIDKIPPAYRDSAEEIKAPKMPAQGPQTGKPSTNAPPISQTLIREGDFAIKLAEALKVGRAQSEAEAESMLASAGIAPKNGWIADYPVTPDIIGELQNSTTEAADSGRLAMKKEEATRAFQDLIAKENLPVRADIQSRDTGTGEASAEASPPQNYPEYYEPSVINNYYYDQGPPIVTYYPPPWDYYYLYAWVPFPFWWGGFWFPGFFCLHNFHRPIFVNGNRVFVSNHFWDSSTRGFGRIDPARRHMGNSMANISPTRGFTSHAASNGASSILGRSLDRTTVNHPEGISGNRVGSSQANLRGRASSVRSPTGYRTPSTGYSLSRRTASIHPTYGGSFSRSGSSSMGSGRSFSPPSRTGGSGSYSSSSGSRGFSGGGGRGRR